ncbi:MAG TPA: transporter [Burkholderiaceae bacterium]|jgi:hypothetical protein
MRIAFCLAMTLCAFTAHADDSINTDRPDIANGADVIGRGHVQLETGLAGDKSKGEHSFGTPLLLRIGLSDDWELRLDSDGYQRLRQDGMSARGWGDLGLGAKWHLMEGEGSTPSIGLLGHLSFATGSGGFRGQGTRPEIDLAMEWDLSAGYDLSFMPGLYRDRNDAGQTYTGGVLALSLGKAFNEQTHGFIELAGQQLASSANGGKLVTLDTGVSYLLGKDMQVDAAVFRGLNHQSPDWQWTVGFSVRF